MHLYLTLPYRPSRLASDSEDRPASDLLSMLWEQLADAEFDVLSVGWDAPSQRVRIEVVASGPAGSRLGSGAADAASEIATRTLRALNCSMDVSVDLVPASELSL